MKRAFIAILLLLVFLLLGVGSASAYIDAEPKNRVGDFFGDTNEVIWENQPPALGNTRGNHFSRYDSATGVWVYVVQNPWSKFDPQGLAELDFQNAKKVWKREISGAGKILKSRGSALLQRAIDTVNPMKGGPVGAAVRDTIGLYKGAASFVNDPVGVIDKADKAVAKPGALLVGISVDAPIALATGGLGPRVLKSKPGGDSASVTKNKVDLELEYKEGWTDAQRSSADIKAQRLTDSDTVVTKDYVRDGTEQSRYRKENNLDSTQDADHTVDLQLGGDPGQSNLSGLDSSVNRSMGSQIHHKTKNLPEGTIVDKVKMVEKKKKKSKK